MDDAGQRARRARLRACAPRARSGFQVLLHVSTDDLGSRRPSCRRVARYRSQGRAARAATSARSASGSSAPGTRPTTPASRPTAARRGRRASSARCTGWSSRAAARCGVVALDVLDQARRRALHALASSAALSPTYRRRATIVGIHNYGDVNRRRTTFTRNIIRTAHHYNRAHAVLVHRDRRDREVRAQLPVQRPRARRSRLNTHVLARAALPDRAACSGSTSTTGPAPGCSARFDAGLISPNGTPRAGLRHGAPSAGQLTCAERCALAASEWGVDGRSRPQAASSPAAASRGSSAAAGWA